ncbi:hypothetical protein [Bradyrhizobium nanningense]|uniref:hypothetical protein n=1 Tax=Bradyrhizobium nanningense TaxID=1325118 RepID=UPI0013E8E2B9|nr:hypothetical protein [Bradyrhizobium nanningense]
MRVLARVIPSLSAVEFDSEELKTICIFSGLGLLVSLLALMTGGLDTRGALF